MEMMGMKQLTQMAAACGITLASACAGLVNAPIWTFLLCGSGLALIAIWEQQKLRSRFGDLGAGDVLSMAHLASVADGCIVAAAAWGVGMLLRAALLVVAT
jgi:hypothetical protein